MLEFEATLVKLPGKMGWPVFFIPASFTDPIGIKGRINVRLVIDGAQFHTTLLPSRNGHYQVYNREIRDHCGKRIGETVHALIEADDQPRELEVPQDIVTALAACETVKVRFDALPYYMRREEINKIISAKTQPTREKRIKALLDKYGS